MLTILTGAGILSKESGIELNTMSKPDEKKRIEKQEKEAQEQLIQSQMREQNNEEQVKGGEGE
jgi:hypothetical protein